jgi:chemotaxis protein MotA
MAETGRKKNGGIDLATVAGIGVALGAILGGLVLEGGQIGDILQLTAAMIVLGGTIGAVMVATPPRALKGAMRRLLGVVRDSSPPLDGVLHDLIEYSKIARKGGLMALDDITGNIADPFMRKGLMLAVDGSDLQEIRGMLGLEIEMEEARAEADARVFESAGGYAPTIGIIGAVLGLIQVMKNLANIDEVGHGIAVAFVATVYGVGVANLLFLPAAQKIKARAHLDTRRREMIVEGIAGIMEGLNPKLLQARLEVFTRTPGKCPEPARAAESEAAATTPKTA